MLKVYNTLSGEKEALKQIGKKTINLFVCGPTVYDESHLGHARTYLAFDMIAKYLKTQGYSVFYLQNITDIDDKIINRAKERKINPSELANYFKKKYLEDTKALKINGINKYAEASKHIKEIIGQVKRLLKDGYAYQIEDGVYYDISKFKDYGKLSRRNVLQAEDAVSRIDEAKNKKNRGDFCLWKLSKKGEPFWPSPFGQGRPGWHIEDTAITEKYLGQQYDIHGGARDLIFPHHEAEIAQMEAISNKKPMVKYWLHTGFLTVNGQKMSKSLGNFIAIKEFTNKKSARVLRFLVLKNHYRSPIDYNEKAAIQAEKEIEKIDEFVSKLLNLKIASPSGLNLKEFEKDFTSAMEDDFNTPEAVAVIFELISRGNSLIGRDLLSKTDAKNILEFFKKIDGFFNFIFWPKPKEKLPKELLDLTKQRDKYRTQKNWQKADEVRQEIMKRGWHLEDTAKGPKLKKIK